MYMWGWGYKAGDGHTQCMVCSVVVVHFWTVGVYSVVGGGVQCGGGGCILWLVGVQCGRWGILCDGRDVQCSGSIWFGGWGYTLWWECNGVMGGYTVWSMGVYCVVGVYGVVGEVYIVVGV